MSDYDKVTARWVDRALGRTDLGPLSAREGRMYSNWQHEIFSYGSHFEMGRFLFNKDRSPKAVLLNGDRWGPTTSRHQARVRSAAQGTGLPVVIIPYSALDAAGIRRDTVELIDVMPDRIVPTYHSFYEWQPGWQWRDDPINAYVDLTQEELDALAARRFGKAYGEWEKRHQYALEELGQIKSYYTWRQYLREDSKPTWAQARASIHEHEKRQWRQVDSERNLYTSARGNVIIDVEQLEDGRTHYSWTTHRHWLGGSLITGEVPWTEWRRCKACNGFQASRETPSDQVCRTCWGRGRVSRERRRVSYFVSDFDHNEPSEVYFFCELPQGVKPKTLDEAIEALKPDTVRLAEQMGRDVARQGDIFAVHLEKLTKRELRKAGARFEKRGQLLGTNHVATEVAYLPTGQTLARGTLRHAPDGRRPDHVLVPLTRGWHVVVKNTVPVAA